MQRLYIGFEITQNHFRALNLATPKRYFPPLLRGGKKRCSYASHFVAMG